MIKPMPIAALSYLPLAMCVAMAFQARAVASDFDPWTQTARYELEHRVALGEWSSGDGDTVRAWFPMPADNSHQRVLSQVIESPWKYRETTDGHGNRLLYVEFDGNERAAGELVMRFIVERSPLAGIPAENAKPNTPLDPQRYLSASSRIPLVGKVRDYAKRADAGLTTDATRIRAYYDYVTKTMKYAKYGVGWGRGDAVWACDSKYGNCTDFHSVIVGMCRSRGVPARFVMGFSIPPDKKESQITGYHCWAEAYDHKFGWVPMDASDAWKAKRLDDYYGHLPSDRVAYVVGRDLILEPHQNGPPLNFFIYPYVEVNGKPVENVPWKTHARRIDPKEKVSERS